MKLFFLAHANSVHSHRWIRFFAQQGHTIFWMSVTTPLDTDVIRHANVSFLHLKGLPYQIPGIGLYAMMRRLNKEIHQFSPDIFHIHYVGFNGALATLLNFHPTVVTAWGSDILFAGKAILKRPFVKRVLRSADLITCDADHMKKSIARFGVEEKKIKIIQFGIDTKRFKQGDTNETLMQTLHLSGKKTVISLRNFELVYNVDSLIRAIPLIMMKVPNAHFLLVGQGSQEQALRSLVKDLKVSDAVTFLGFIPNEDLPDYLRSIDVYVSTSLSDAGIASSTAEAMACARAVVITDSGENRVWITDAKNGFLVPTQNHEILAQKIIQLLCDKDLRLRFGTEARTTIEERNDYYQEMQKMEELYKTLIAHK